MIFWNVSIVTVLILAMIKLLTVLGCPKHKGYPTDSFSQVEILEKQWRLKFSKTSRKVAWLQWQHTSGLTGGTELFLMENT